jgi:hypothetical protein
MEYVVYIDAQQFYQFRRKYSQTLERCAPGSFCEGHQQSTFEISTEMAFEANKFTVEPSCQFAKFLKETTVQG